MIDVISALHVYFIFGILYNVLSQVLLDCSGRKLAPTDPTNGALIVSLVYVVFLLQDELPETARVFLLVVWTIAIIRFGIVHHLLNFDQKEYFSRTSWFLAIFINLCGVCLLVLHLLQSA